MTQADRVHSTPRTTVLKIVAGTTAPPADPHEAFFKQHDPALRAINAHRQAANIHLQAVEIQFASEGKVTKAAYARLTETCACRKSNLGILVMQPAENWATKNVPG
jgi:hypothetical protein